MKKANAEYILDELDTHNIKLRLYTFPQRLKYQKAICRQHRTEHEEAMQAKLLIEAELTADIAAAVNEAGKAAYSNDTARRAELTRRMNLSEEYQTAAHAARQAEYAVSEAQDELSRLEDEFKALRIVARLVSEEVALYASDGTENEAVADTAEVAAAAQPF